MTQDFKGPWDAEIWTAARGLQEINARCREGWAVFHLQLVMETRRRGTARMPEIAQALPYAIMGRARTEGESDDQMSQAAQEASVQGSAALAAAPEPLPPGDSEESAEAQPEVGTEAPAVPARRTAPRRGQDTGAGELKTTGLRG